MKYRKKPVVIEAILWTGSMQDAEAFGIHECSQELTSTSLQISTLEGVMAASYGDYIIKGVKGEFYPCKPDIFAATYEPVATAE